MLSTDRLAVVLAGFNISKSDFIRKYAELKGITTGGARNSLNGWLRHDNQPNDVATITATLEALVPGENMHRLMLDDVGPHELLAACRTDFQTVMGAVSKYFSKAMEGAHVTGLNHLTSYALSQPDFAKRRLSRLLGRWAMYRRHSAQIGLLRETILVTAVHDCMAVATYHQFNPEFITDPTRGHRAIDSSLFYCGDTVFTFGCLIYEDNRKIDPVVTSILERAFNLPPPYHQLHFPGILLAPADGNAVPSAMRIIVRQDDVNPVPVMPLAGIVTDPEEAAIYYAGIDNALLSNEHVLHMSCELMASKLRKGWADAEPLRAARMRDSSSTD